MATIFITREISEDDPGRRLIEDAGHELIGRSLLSFEAIPTDIPAEADWLFAYSRQAVEAICKGEVLAEAFRQNPGLRLAAVGEGTAAAWSAKGYRLEFVGSGAPESVAGQFAKVAAGKTVAFLQAEQSRRSIERLLGSSIYALQVVCYRATETASTLPKDIEIACLSSPRNAAIFLRSYTTDTAPVLFAIGQPTAEAVKQAGFTPDLVATEPSVHGLLVLATSYLARKA